MLLFHAENMRQGYQPKYELILTNQSLNYLGSDQEISTVFRQTLYMQVCSLESFADEFSGILFETLQ